MIHWSRFLPGFCYIRIRGESVERFVNLAMERNVKLWDIRRETDSWTAACSLYSLQALRHIGHQTGCFFTIEQEKGLPILYRHLRRRKGLALGVLIAFFLLVLFSHSIIDVRVTGDLPRDLTEERVLELAAEYDVKPAVWPGRIDYQAASEAILRQEPSLTWVGFQKNGVVVTIEVVPREEPTPQLGEAGNIVAVKDGYLRELLVFKGQQVAVVDQPVKAGDILISGLVQPVETDGSLAAGFTVAAEGIARGSVWYEATGYAGYTVAEPAPTGEMTAALTVTWDERSYQLWGSREHDYRDAVVEEGDCFTLSLFNHTLSGQWTLFREVRAELVQMTEDETLARAKEEAMAQIMSKVPPGAKIIDRRFEPCASVEGVVGVKLIVETYEDLGKFVLMEEAPEDALPPTE